VFSDMSKSSNSLSQTDNRRCNVQTEGASSIISSAYSKIHGIVRRSKDSINTF